MSEALADDLRELAGVLAALGRDELARRTAAAIARTTRPATVICVVGEFKQGKSSLVNTLVGVDVCPVDDDLATAAVTIVRYGAEVTANVVHRAADDAESAITTTPVEPDRLGEWVTEAGNPGNRRGVERVELTAPGRLLHDGVMIVDTPGAGGMHAGQAAATLAFLPFADGLIFASDATSELTAPEIEFLRAATERCPTVVMALTKIDLQPEWRRIRDIDNAHLAAAGIDIAVVGVSSTLNRAAKATGDHELDALSGIPALVAQVGVRVVGPARADAGTRAATEALATIAQVRAALVAERDALADRAVNAATLAEAEEAQARLAHLQGPAARWQQVVGDRTTDLATRVSVEFRGTVRDLTRAMDERIEQLRTPEEFAALSAELQEATATCVAEAFTGLEAGRQAIRDELAALIGTELPRDPAGGSDSLDMGVLWDAAARPPTGPSAARRVLQSGLGTLRGAQGGIIMFGMVGGFLPLAAGALLASAPVMLGVGALFASMSFGEDRQRRQTARRQQARQQVRQFLDDVGYQVSNRLNEVARTLPRELRDEFGELLAELHRTTREVLTAAQAATQQSTEQRSARTAEIDRELGALAALAARFGAPVDS